MSSAGARATQNAVRSKTGVMTAAALFYLSGAMETEAEPAASDQTTTEQAPTPAPQQTAPAQSPSTQTEQKSDTLPTVSVQASRPRAPAAVRAAPSRPVAAPPPPAQPVATDQAGSGGSNPPLGPTPYQVTNTGITRLPVPILNMPQTVNVIPQAIIQEQNVTHGRAGPAIHSRHHLQRRGRRPARRRPDHPRLRRARRPVPRRHPRSRLVYPRRVLDRPHRSLQGPVGVRVRPRRDRRRHQLCDQAADRCELSRVDLVGDDGQRLSRGGRRQRQERQRVRPHPGALAGRQHADPRPDLDQALGRRAVHGLRLSAGHQGDAVLHLSGRGGRIGLRLHLSAAAERSDPKTGAADQSRLLRQRQAYASAPDPSHQLLRACGRAARRYHDDRHPHHHGKDRA